MIPADLRTRIYVYYRVLPDASDHVRRQVMSLQEDIRQSGVRARLERRLDDALTWMEVYENVEDSAALMDSLSRGAAARGLDSQAVLERERRAEIFIADMLEPGAAPPCA